LLQTPIFPLPFNHTTEKDKDHGAKVMKKWNAIRGKNSMGYLSRMKHSVNLKSFDVLEISNILKWDLFGGCFHCNYIKNHL
jgi:hypothetical protein